jgi:hypothetical protein
MARRVGDATYEVVVRLTVSQVRDAEEAVSAARGHLSKVDSRHIVIVEVWRVTA